MTLAPANMPRPMAKFVRQKWVRLVIARIRGFKRISLRHFERAVSQHGYSLKPVGDLFTVGHNDQDAVALSVR